ncbi:MAG: hypothetical protein JW953_12750 [Anaerolineae bacterium]|nr:hypothetical protein [Anaerolineae bacterium]
MTKVKIWFTCGIFITLLSVMAISQALAAPENQATTCNVPTQYATIGAALANPACTLIRVAANTYHENLTITRSVTIEGVDTETTIIDGGDISSVFVITNSATVMLDKLTIYNGAGTDADTDSLGGGIYNYNGNLTVRDSYVYYNAADYGGGIFNSGTLLVQDSSVSGNTGLYHGGGIHNYGTLSVRDSLIYNNDADQFGGGIYNETGAMILSGSEVSENVADQGGGLTNLGGTTTIEDTDIISNTAQAAGGILNEAINFNSRDYNAVMTVTGSRVLSNTSDAEGGGGLLNASRDHLTATLTISNSLVSYNVANGSDALNGTGGGIWNASGSSGGLSRLNINNSTISHNRAVNGGGIANAFDSATISHKLEVTVNNSTISHNSTLALTGNQVGNGGGLFNMNGTMTLVNSTLSGNAANGIPGAGTDVSGMGGGAVNAGSTLISRLILTNTTVTGNHANVTGGGLGTGLLDPAAWGTATTLKNSLVAGNSATMLPANCTSQPTSAPNMFVSQGYNLENGNTCNLTQASDLINTDPLLGPLADNGGPTQTHALPPGSPAIDQGHTGSFNTDQRGRPRPVDMDNIANATGGDGSDIGAYEFGQKIYLPVIYKVK